MHYIKKSLPIAELIAVIAAVVVAWASLSVIHSSKQADSQLTCARPTQTSEIVASAMSAKPTHVKKMDPRLPL